MYCGATTIKLHIKIYAHIIATTKYYSESNIFVIQYALTIVSFFYLRTSLQKPLDENIVIFYLKKNFLKLFRFKL